MLRRSALRPAPKRPRRGGLRPVNAGAARRAPGGRRRRRMARRLWRRAVGRVQRSLLVVPRRRRRRGRRHVVAPPGPCAPHFSAVLRSAQRPPPGGARHAGEWWWYMPCGCCGGASDGRASRCELQCDRSRAARAPPAPCCGRRRCTPTCCKRAAVSSARAAPRGSAGCARSAIAAASAARSRRSISALRANRSLPSRFQPCLTTTSPSRDYFAIPPTPPAHPKLRVRLEFLGDPRGDRSRGRSACVAGLQNDQHGGSR